MSWDPLQNWNGLRRADIPDEDLGGTPSCLIKVDTGYGNARFALGPNDETRLLIPCSDNDLGLNLNAAGNITVGFVSYNIDSRKQRFIDLLCRERSLEVVFGDLADVLLARLHEGSGPSEAVEKTITDFRRLLNSTTASAVNKITIVGLLGELIVLRSLAMHDPDCIGAWLGPWDQRHDFRCKTKSLEVKTSSRSDATEVHVNGIDQLRPPTGGELVLAHVCLEISADGSIFLSSLFDQLLEAGVDSLRLMDALAELGCLDPNDDSWNLLRFETQSIKAWRVKAGFPRLTGEEIRPEIDLSGVSELQYKVDLSQASNYQISRAEYDAYLSKFMA
jgi:hypothetical protein